MTLKEIEDELRHLNDESQKRGYPTPFKVDCYELVELADALKAERERIEAYGATMIPCENCEHIGHFRCCECGQVQGST